MSGSPTQGVLRSSIDDGAFFVDNPKTLKSGPTPKALGSTSDPALASWYEQAYAYYQQVQAGQQPMPDGSSWDEFLQQMQWAYSQLFQGGSSGGWEPVAPSGPQGSGPVQQANDPFGGSPGASGDLVHTAEKARVGFTGN